ncbi:MAG: Rieske 2Fe-2S domain-containing protein [Ketobacter sp.]|nr:Rieske 2Fe-2S domain-containing protein [Ketobacter sp.]
MGTIVCKTTDIPVGGSKAFETEGEKVLVFHLEDGFYATQARCTHLFMSLEKGKIMEGCNVQCPFHRAQFDIRTGEVAKWANFPPGVQLLNAVRKEKALKTFPVQVQGDDVVVG